MNAIIDPISDESDDDHVCHNCDGSGELLICWDDICQGQGYCMHGDGTIICPVCKGSGE